MPGRPTLLVLTAIALIFAASPAARAQQSEKVTRLNKAYEAAMAAEAADRWDEAVRLYREVLTLAPHEITSLASLARCCGRLGKPDEALAALQEAVEHGWNQVEQLKSEPAFDALRARPEYATLLERIAEVDAQNILIYVPASAKREPAPPLIVAFHGRGENPHYFLSAWRQAADELGAVLALPRGVRRAARNMLNMWDTPDAPGAPVDLAACAPLALEAIELAAKRHPIDRDRIILAGYSQGGAVALGLLAKDPQRYAGALAQASIYKGAAEDWSATPAADRRPVYLLVGDEDKLRPQSETARDHLKAAGWNVHFELVEKTGHEPPEDNPRRQVAAIRHILAAR